MYNYYYYYNCIISSITTIVSRCRSIIRAAGADEKEECRPRENMVGVNMVLAEYPQHTLYHRICIVHV